MATTKANEVSDLYNPDACKNFDVVGCVDRLDRILYELCTSESATINDFVVYDQERFLASWAVVDNYIKVIQSQDRLDLPHSFPAMYHFNYYTQLATNEDGEPIEWEKIKNSFVRDLARLVANAMIQWSRSESADQSNRFAPADQGRWDKIYARGVAMVNEYANNALPADLPESSDFELSKRGIPAGIES